MNPTGWEFFVPAGTLIAVKLLSDFLGAREPIQNATGCPTLVIFAVAGEEGNFRSSPT